MQQQQQLQLQKQRTAYTHCSGALLHASGTAATTVTQLHAMLLPVSVCRQQQQIPSKQNSALEQPALLTVAASAASI